MFNWIIGGILLTVGGLTLVIGLFNSLFPSTKEKTYRTVDKAITNDDPKVHLFNVGETIMAIRGRSTQKYVGFETMRETILVWTPIYDAVVALFAETVEGHQPSLRVGPDGKPLRNEQGNFIVEGGWPCQKYPEGWQQRAKAIFTEFQLKRVEYKLSGKPVREKENFSRLRVYISVAATDPRRLSGWDVGSIRQILAGIATKRGLPGSAIHRELRKRQLAELPTLSESELWRVVTARLETLPSGDGLDAPIELLKPVSPIESEAVFESREITDWGSTQADIYDPDLHLNFKIPQRIQRKVLNALHAPLRQLIEMNIVSQGTHVLAVVPQLQKKTSPTSTTEFMKNLDYAFVSTWNQADRDRLITSARRLITDPSGNSLTADDSFRRTTELITGGMAWAVIACVGLGLFISMALGEFGLFG